MAYNLSRKTLILAKTQTAAGTDSVPTAAANAMLAFNEVNPISVDTKIVQLQPLRASFTGFQQIVGRQKVMVKPKMALQNAPLAGASPAGGLPPYFAAFLKACGLAETSGVSSGSSYVQYAPTSNAFFGASIYVYAQDILHKVLDAVGNGILDMKAGDAAMWEFSMEGTYQTPANNGTTLPAPASITYPKNSYTLVESESVTIGGFAPVLISARLDFGNKITERSSFNASRGYLSSLEVDRDSKLNLVLECENDLSNKNFFDLLSKGTVVDNIDLTHGVNLGQGNLCLLHIDKPQLTKVDYQDQNGIRTYALEYTLQSLVDDGEFSITFK